MRRALVAPIVLLALFSMGTVFPNGVVFPGGGGSASVVGITTGAVLTSDGSQIAEGSAGCIDAGGVLTCDGFVSRASTAPQPKVAFFQAHGCSIAAGGTVKTVISSAVGSNGCQNFDAGGATAVRGSIIPINQDRALNLRSLTFTLITFNIGAGWEDPGTGEAMEFTLSRCTLDTTPAYADCTDIDTFVVQNEATPTITYGASSRTAKSCNAISCIQTFTIDGGGRASSAGDPTIDAGVADYLVLWYEVDATNWTADLSTDPGTITAQFVLDFEN